MVPQTIALNSPASTVDPKVEVAYFIGDTASRSSQPSCISVRAYLPPLCSPVMEATKNLAQRLRHRASLRRASRKTSRSEAAAEYRGSTTALDADRPQKAARRDGEKHRASASASASDIPANTPLDAPPPAPAAAAADATAARLATAPDAPLLSPSPGSDVSPTSQQPPRLAGESAGPDLTAPSDTPTSGYFALDAPADEVSFNKISFAIPNKLEDGAGADVGVDGRGQERPLDSPSLQTATSSASPSTAVSPRESEDDETTDAGRSSIGGRTRSSFNSRYRNSSLSIPLRFRKHVAFTNVSLGEPTKCNFPSHTLVIKHPVYASKRRSRTFMVGIDDHQYSDEALQWLFDKFVDDGDEIVCVRVVERDVRMYETDRRLEDLKKEANAEVERIKAKLGDGKAISIVLEYAVGKLHSTFQRLIQLHQPSMLIVGTRGRTLGGFQGLVASRNSFSKYCLQYSPIPVVVVRPDEKRQKKKDKRDNDPDKQSYRQMLQSSQGVHEANDDSVGAWEIESKLSADEEAGKVAKALGLPAKFDPTLKPYKPSRQKSSLSMATTLSAEPEPGRLVADPAMTPSASAANSEDEAEVSGEDEDDVEGEFEVTAGAKLLQSQKQELKAQLEAQQEEQKKKDRLHAMEVGEGAALLKKPEELDTDEDEDEDEEDGGGAVKTSSAEQ